MYKMLGSSSYKNMHMQAYMYMYMYAQGNIIQHMETRACIYIRYMYCTCTCTCGGSDMRQCSLTDNLE